MYVCFFYSTEPIFMCVCVCVGSATSTNELVPGSGMVLFHHDRVVKGTEAYLVPECSMRRYLCMEKLKFEGVGLGSG